MARITVEDCLRHVNDRFKLVLLASERTRELDSGAKSDRTATGDKNTVTALREIASGEVACDDLYNAAIMRFRRGKAQPCTEVSDDLVDELQGEGASELAGGIGIDGMQDVIEADISEEGLDVILADAGSDDALDEQPDASDDVLETDEEQDSKKPALDQEPKAHIYSDEEVDDDD